MTLHLRYPEKLLPSKIKIQPNTVRSSKFGLSLEFQPSACTRLKLIRRSHNKLTGDVFYTDGRLFHIRSQDKCGSQNGCHVWIEAQNEETGMPKLDDGDQMWFSLNEYFANYGIATIKAKF